MVIILLLALAGAYLAGEAYKRYATPEQKRRWENFAKVHHGEAGILMVGAGVAVKSPTLAASGVGLILHDRDDYKKWFARNRAHANEQL